MNEQIEKSFDYIKDQEESINERILNKERIKYVASMFEDVRHERSLKILLPVTDPVIVRHGKFTDQEFNIIKNSLREIT